MVLLAGLQLGVVVVDILDVDDHLSRADVWNEADNGRA